MSGSLLPLQVLLGSFLRRSSSGETLSERTQAIRAAAEWLNPDSLQRLSTPHLSHRLSEFTNKIGETPWHAERIARQAGFVRHGINHLLAGTDWLSTRFERCVSPNGPYAVVGAGRSFWAAVLKATAPDTLPDWVPDVEAGVERVGGYDQTPERLGTTIRLYESLRAEHLNLSAHDLDRFFSLLARLRGRELPSNAPSTDSADAIRDRVRTVRVQQPLRRRMAHHGDAFARLRKQFDAANGSNDLAAVIEAVRELCGVSFPFDWNRVRELIDSGSESPSFDEFAVLGLSVPAALLHLSDPKWYPLWRNEYARGLAELDDAFHPDLSPRDRYALFRDVVSGLRERFAVHPLEAGDVLLASLIGESSPPLNRAAFLGFAADTFRFFADLAGSNSKEWMETERERYQFYVREPMIELCDALTRRYVEPVLAREYGWDLVTDPRPGKALTSIVKNDYGRTAPYTPELWITYYRRTSGGKRNDAQLFVKIDASGVRFGFHLGRTAREAGRRFRRAIQDHGELVFRAVHACGANDAFTFRGRETEFPLRSAVDLRAWAVEKELIAERHLAPDHPLLRSDDLVGEILIAFDRLVPLFAAAVEDDPRAVLAKRSGDTAEVPPFDREAFHRATFLSESWLNRTLDLLSLKKQLILHGVPGTGKTHVARCLARLLTNDRNGAVRLVQFHPAYSYEEFVEGIRPRSVEANGRTEMTYPVEDGVLCEFAAMAEAHPSVPHVLLVDEINRGNLPRIFGELLFLLEYRDQAVTLPHSKRAFRLPSNLYLIGTMNAADRSTQALDQALRRRFSFVEMPADAAVLAGWLEQHLAPAAGGEGREEPDSTFGPRVVRLFEELNHRLAHDLGPDKQIGHSFFMVPGLTEGQLSTVWDHHVRPLLGDYFAARGVPVGYDWEKLWDREPKRKRETV
jgi:uncharacterized protein (DUF2461 family)